MYGPFHGAGNRPNSAECLSSRLGRGEIFVAAERRHSFGTRMIVPGYNGSQPVKMLERGGTIQGNRPNVFLTERPGNGV